MRFKFLTNLDGQYGIHFAEYHKKERSFYFVTTDSKNGVARNLLKNEGEGSPEKGWAGWCYISILQKRNPTTKDANYNAELSKDL